MRILHLFANYKWTGPADPAIRCAGALRRAGADVVFAQAEWTLPDAEHRMAKELKKSRMPVIAGLGLRKHFHVPTVLHDARALRARLDRGEFDVVHSHLLGDHLVAAVAKRRTSHRPVLVRSYYEPEAPSRRGWRERVALRYTDGVVVPTRIAGAQLRSRFRVPGDRIIVQDPPIDGGRRCGVGTLREEWGLDDDTFLIGITARIQPHRRFELLWEVTRRLVDSRPKSKVVLLGRGNPEDTEALVREPVRRLGLEDHVILPGYLYEPRYSDALRSLDAFMFLVPGSDGTCRAVREAFAIGLPVVATRRGILPELLGPSSPSAVAVDRPAVDESAVDESDARCGIAVEETVDGFCDALTELHDSRELRKRLGDAALARSLHAMDPDRAARRLLAFYERLASAQRDGSRW